jgi:hypothetical protein
MKRLQELLNSRGAKLKIDGIIGPKTMEVLTDFIRLRFRDLGYPEPKRLLIGLRTDETLSNTFDDFMVYWDSKVVDVWECSTTAGKYYVQNPLTVGGITGTAILQAGYYAQMWKFVTGANWANLWLKAPYFQQINACDIYRDGNKDTAIDKRVTQRGLYGINGHRAGIGSFVDRWSAGCQVTPDAKWFKVIQRFKAGEVVDYCLLNFSP